MDLKLYFKGVLRWWWLFLICTGVAAGVSYKVSSAQPRVYQTTTTLMVGQVLQQENPSGQDFILTERLAESYAQIARRQPVVQGAIESLGLEMSWQSLAGRVRAYSIPRTQLLAVTVKDTSPERAVAVADEIAYQLILQSPSSPQNELRTSRSEFVHSQLDALEGRIARAEGRLAELQTELDSAFSARQIQSLESEIGTLENLINGWQGNYSELLSFLEGGDSPNYLTIIEPAQLPYNPVSPNIELNVMLAAAAGFMLAFGAALLLEYLDDTVKTSGDLNRVSGLTVLGKIDRLKGKDQQQKLVSAETAFLPEAESFRMLRTNIQFVGVDEPTRSILITSANPGEGKSTTAANLALVMAQAELRTIIVDADLRRPTIHNIFQVPNFSGLTDLLFTPEPDIEAQLINTGTPNLQVITSGPLPPNSSELLGSKRMAQLIKRLNEIADVIIFDSPPVLPVTDAAVLSKQTDGVLLITRAKQTRREAVKEAVHRLQQVDAKLLGVVFNDASGTRRRAQDTYYASSYNPGWSNVGGQAYQSYSASNRAKKRSWWQKLPVLRFFTAGN